MKQASRAKPKVPWPPFPHGAFTSKSDKMHEKPPSNSQKSAANQITKYGKTNRARSQKTFYPLFPTPDPNAKVSHGPRGWPQDAKMMTLSITMEALTKGAEVQLSIKKRQRLCRKPLFFSQGDTKLTPRNLSDSTRRDIYK